MFGKEVRLAKRLQKALSKKHQRGIVSAEKEPCLQEQPLQEELQAADWLEMQRSLLDPPTGFVESTRPGVSTRAASLGKPRPTRWLGGVEQALRSRQAVSMALIVLAAFIVFNGAIAVHASKVAIPGDLVYPVKTVVESLQLAVSFSNARDAELHLQFAERRLTELQYLSLESRYEYIASTSLNYKRHVSRALVLIDSIRGKDVAMANQLGENMRQLLDDSYTTLGLVAGFVPASSGSELSSAIWVSTRSSAIADAINGK